MQYGLLVSVCFQSFACVFLLSVYFYCLSYAWMKQEEFFRSQYNMFRLSQSVSNHHAWFSSMDIVCSHLSEFFSKGFFFSFLFLKHPMQRGCILLFLRWFYYYKNRLYFYVCHGSWKICFIWLIISVCFDCLNASNLFHLSQSIFSIWMPGQDIFLTFNVICFACLSLFSKSPYRVFFQKGWFKRNILVFHTSQSVQKGFSMSYFFERKLYFLNLNLICFACLSSFFSSRCLKETRRIF